MFLIKDSQSTATRGRRSEGGKCDQVLILAEKKGPRVGFPLIIGINNEVLMSNTETVKVIVRAGLSETEKEATLSRFLSISALSKSRV
jgi:hypothetical protein